MGILESLSGILTAIEAYAARKNRSRDLEISAFRALITAVTKSEGYIAEKRKNNQPDNANYELTEAWFQASIAFMHANDSNMQGLCNLKGDYWTNPDDWSDDQLILSGIKLKSMRERLSSILKG